LLAFDPLLDAVAEAGETMATAASLVNCGGSPPENVFPGGSPRIQREQTGTL